MSLVKNNKKMGKSSKRTFWKDRILVKNKFNVTIIIQQLFYDELDDE